MILVLGQGLLGSWICFRYPRETIGLSRRDADATDAHSMLDKIEEIAPDAVINCIGITERHPEPYLMHSVNASFPHRLASMCDLVGAKLIQVSTDCVFSGDRGQYTEEDTPDASSEYGKTKAKGEVYSKPHLTVRTSFVGFPDPNARGLMAWLHSNKNGKVDGYDGVRWNGLCVNVLSDILVDLCYRHINGLIHIYGESLSKCDLLNHMNDVYGWGITITSVQEPMRDMTLSSVKKTAIVPVLSTHEQLVEMRVWADQYREFLLESKV